MSKVLTFLYIEDDMTMMRDFQEVVDNYLINRDVSINWRTYTQLSNDIDLTHVDACFFDIEVHQHSTLDYMKEHHIDVPIIIVTQYLSYMYEATHLHIFDYIKKNDNESIYRCLDYLLIDKDNRQMIMEKGNGHLYMFYLKDICYIEKDGHQLYIYKCNGERIDLWKKYDDVFQDYPSLLQVHKSKIINTDYCLYIDQDGAHMKNGMIIKVSRRYYKKIMKDYHLTKKA